MLTGGSTSPSSEPLAAVLADSATAAPSESAIAGAVNRCLEDGPMLVPDPRKASNRLTMIPHTAPGMAVYSGAYMRAQT
jgi:hypothetical protein